MSQQMVGPHDCAVPDCDDRGEVITPEGVMCDDHAAALYEEETA